MTPTFSAIWFPMNMFKDTTILFGYMCGVVNAKGRRHTKKIFRDHHPDFVILLETHCAFSSASQL